MTLRLSDLELGEIIENIKSPLLEGKHIANHGCEVSEYVFSNRSNAIDNDFPRKVWAVLGRDVWGKGD